MKIIRIRIQAFRRDHRLNEGDSLADKLGDRAPQYYASPFYKLDLHAAGSSDWASLADELERVHHAGVIHLVAFQEGGHDENYPDFLPPDPRWGSYDQFKQFINRAQEAGHLVVPYTNFSWWGKQAETVNTLPGDLTLQDIVVKRENGQMLQENYGPHSGYVVNPHHPFVQERIAEEHRKFVDEAGVDGIFEDQWGIRDTPFMFNEEVPEHADPSNAYIEAMKNYFSTIEHPHYVEDGFDILIPDAVGFMGSTLLWDQLGYRGATSSFTQYYPMMGMFARDQVMQFQHDLAPETMTHSREMLRWNLAMGYHLSVDLAQGITNPWIDVAGVFQREVLSKYTDQLVESFERFDQMKSVTRFETFEVTANWNDDEPLVLDEQFTLAAAGIQVVADDAHVRAGVYTRYNGYDLDFNDHYIVEVREKDEIRVYQPLGTDTTVAIEKGGFGPHLRAFAHRYGGTEIAELPIREEGGFVFFDYIRNIEGETTGYVRLVPSAEASRVTDVPFEKQAPQWDLAFGQPIRSSTQTADEFAAEKANDGDPFTYWESINRQFPQTLTVDLGDIQIFSRIVLTLPPLDTWGAREQEIEILISENDKDYTTLLSAQNYTFDPKLDNAVEIPFPPAEARYVQLKITGNTEWPAAQISGFQVYR